MEGPGPAALFVGDLDDPWVAAIADALPRGTIRLSCPGDLPDDWPIAAKSARTLILHRQILTNADAERLDHLLEAQVQRSRIILCVGPHARYQQVERWRPRVGVILPEATASETIARHLDEARARFRPPCDRPRVAVVSTNESL